jgi:hypothetical protein
MSDSDSFIEEVTEEVRKDQLYGYYKKYGWIAGAVVLLIVGGAAYSEWSKSRAEAEAQMRGDAIAAALNKGSAADQVAALDSIETTATGTAALLGFQKAAILAEDGQTDAAVSALQSIADNLNLSPIYRDTARFKILILRGKDMDPADRMAALEALATPGNALRPLALEQIAVAQLDAGDTKAAIEQLTQLVSEPNLSEAMRQRAARLLFSLGGEIPAQTQLLSGSETAQ